MNLKKLRALWACLLLLAALPVLSQSKSAKVLPKGEAEKKEDTKKEDEIKFIEEVTKKCEKMDGLFTTYRDTTNGKVFIRVAKNQLNKEYIHFAQIIDGPVDMFSMRGAYGQEKIFTIARRYDKIEITLENSSYYFDPNSALSRAKDANINRPVIYSEKIAGISKNNDEFLIDAEKLFLCESFDQVKPSPVPDEKPGQHFKLGNLTKDKSKLLSIKNYPQNTDVQAELLYEDSYPINQGGTDVTDARFVGVKIHHSLIELPQNDFKPRFDDPRVGYFTDQVTDMTSANAAPYRDFIHRWNLKKKDPAAAISEPVEPITWWIENTTPKELRAPIRDGVLEWNKAFEKAGFKNAVVVKEQPDDATWDAGDIRYNVLRWTSSPRPRFGGYGPSFVNPRTGQILGADVMLEYVFITNRLREGQLFESAAMEHLLDESAMADSRHFCSFAQHLQRSVMLGKQIIQAMDRDKAEEAKLLQQSIYMLVLHEVGHTLGLNHNMKASGLHDPVAIHDEKLGREVGLTGSVMDYSNVNVSLDPKKQGLYYDVIPGPYDVWAIQFGYAPEENKSLLDKSADHALLFGNDADDMRAAGHGIDPRVMIDDMSSDPVAYSVERIQLVNQALPKLKDKIAKPGESYQALRNGFLILTSEVGISLRVISRQVGGIYVDRSMVGQPGAGKPYVPVSYQQQKDAMKMLAQYGFSPAAIQFPNDLYSMLQHQRRGFNHYSVTEDPKLHERTLVMQRDVLNQLMHTSTLQRIVDSELYGNQYKMAEFMTDLTDAIYKDDLGKSVSSMRQNLQTEYTARLIQVMNTVTSTNYVAKAQAFSELNRIKKMLGKAVSPDASTKAHREYVVYLIDEALDTGK